MTEVHPIEAESYRILRSRIDLSTLPPLTRAVTERIIHATADFDYVTDLVCDEMALAAGVEALRRDAPVIADVGMVASGITGHPVICKIGDSLRARLARTAIITLSAAAVRLAHGEAGPRAIWLVGCAPTALAEIMSREFGLHWSSALPVGFVGAADAKDNLRASGLPALSNISEKGGSAVAVAAFNALLRIARKLQEDGLLVPPPPPPLLLAAHGTTDQAGVDAFAALTERVGKLAAADGTRVAGGFIELSEPPLREAVTGRRPASPRAAQARGRGPAHALRGRARQGRHPRRAGPRAHSPSRPDLDVRSARSGRTPLLLNLLANRIGAVGGPDAPAVLLVGRGSTDPDANADVVKTARLLWEGRDYPLAETAFVSLARPDVAQGLERCRLLGAGLPVLACAGLAWPGRPAGARRDRGGQVFPVPWRAAGPGGRTGRRLRRRASRTRHQVHRRARRLRRDRRAGLRAVPRGAGRGHPDELRRVRVPDRDARVRAPRRGAPASP